MTGLITTHLSLALMDGQKAWAEVAGELRRTLDDPLRGLPLVGLIVLVIVIVWANIRVARWLISDSNPGPAHPPAHPIDSQR